MAAKELVDYIENGNITHSVNYPDVASPRSSVCRLTIMHANVEGVISKITTLLSANNINIANIIDKSKGDRAYMLLDLDTKPSDELVGEIAKLDMVTRVRIFN